MKSNVQAEVEEFLKSHMRTWSPEQFDAAEKVEDEIITMFGDGVCVGHLTVLVIEERKRDPETTLQSCADLAALLGAEALLSLRRKAEKRNGYSVSPDVAELAKRRKPQKLRVRGV